MADTSKWKWESHNTDWKNGLFPWGTPGNVINLFGRIVTGDCERHHYCGYFLVDPHYLQRRCRDVPPTEFQEAWNHLISLPTIEYYQPTGVLLALPLWKHWVVIRSSNASNTTGLVTSIHGTLKHIHFNPEGPLEFPFKGIMWPVIKELIEIHNEELRKKSVHVLEAGDEFESATDPVVYPVGAPVGYPLKSESPKSLNLKSSKNIKGNSRVRQCPGPEPGHALETLEVVYKNDGMKAAWKFIEVQDRDQKDALTEHLKKLKG